MITVIFLIAAILMLVACESENEKPEPIHPEILLTYEGCKIIKFFDGGKPQYTSICSCGPKVS
jgi:hypothetical protein